MASLEYKVDLIMKWIAGDTLKRPEIRNEIKAILESEKNADYNYSSDLDDTIEDLLKEFRCPVSTKSYESLAYAIKLTAHDPSYTRSMCSRLYPEVGKKVGITSGNAERCIRHSIERIFMTGDTDAVYKVVGHVVEANKCKATNREFVTACANEVRRRMKNGVKHETRPLLRQKNLNY